VTRPLDGIWRDVAYCLEGGTHHPRAIVALLHPLPDCRARRHTARKVHGALIEMRNVGLVRARDLGGYELTAKGYGQLHG
jgi:hypothetical protein